MERTKRTCPDILLLSGDAQTDKTRTGSGSPPLGGALCPGVRRPDKSKE